jgi:hypothetical protein
MVQCHPLEMIDPVEFRYGTRQRNGAICIKMGRRTLTVGGSPGARCVLSHRAQLLLVQSPSTCNGTIVVCRCRIGFS